MIIQDDHEEPAGGTQGQTGGSLGDGTPGGASLPAIEAGEGLARPGGTGNGPIVVLSYAHSGAQHVQAGLAAGTELACTSGTGILPLCVAAAEAWRRVEGVAGRRMSRLATATVRGLVTAQVTTILAGAGKLRWCELATIAPSAAELFLQIFPQAVFVCVHRSCLDMVDTGIRANPWGLQSQWMMPYLQRYSANSVASLAAYWADSAEGLLAFEKANPGSTRRVRYEDAAVTADETLSAVRAWLQLPAERSSTFSAQSAFPEPVAQPLPPDRPEVPVEMIPQQLRQRITRLQVELGYGPLPE
jgi:hypothetical protein